jgi:hypothetical protein
MCVLPSLSPETIWDGNLVMVTKRAVDKLSLLLQHCACKWFWWHQQDSVGRNTPAGQLTMLELHTHAGHLHQLTTTAAAAQLLAHNSQACSASSTQHSSSPRPDSAAAAAARWQ